MACYLQLTGRANKASDLFLLAVNTNQPCPVWYHLARFHRMFMEESYTIPRVNLMRTALEEMLADLILALKQCLMVSP